MLETKSTTAWMDYYTDTLSGTIRSAEATLRDGQSLPINAAVHWIHEAVRKAHDSGSKLMFIGNGGSAGIASHMATDYSKNGNLRSLAFNDASMLTCIANDYSYDQVFAKQIEFHGRAGDVLFAISSSGKSASIVNAAKLARDIGMTVVTLSGFRADNPLRNMGDMNLFLNATLYGFVEIGHLALCHSILDYSMEQDGRGAAGLK